MGGPTGLPRVTADSRFVVLASRADNLPGANGFEQIYRYERGASEGGWKSLLVSKTSGGDPSPADCKNPSIADTGNRIVFETAAALVPAVPAGLRGQCLPPYEHVPPGAFDHLTDDFYLSASSAEGAVGDVVAVDLSLTVEARHGEPLGLTVVVSYDPRPAELLGEPVYSETIRGAGLVPALLQAGWQRQRRQQQRAAGGSLRGQPRPRPCSGPLLGRCSASSGDPLLPPDRRGGAELVLGTLFRGEDSVMCLQAADYNEDGDVKLSDPVAILNWLFRGGRAPREREVLCQEVR